MWRHLLTLLVVSGFVLAGGSPVQSAAAPAPSEPEVPEQLLKERLETARNGLKAAEEAYRVGRDSGENVFLWTRRVLEAELALTDKKADRVAAYEKLAKLARQMEETAKAQYDLGRLSTQGMLDASYRRIEAEIELARARAK